MTKIVETIYSNNEIDLEEPLNKWRHKMNMSESLSILVSQHPIVERRYDSRKGRDLQGTPGPVAFPWLVQN